MKKIFSIAVIVILFISLMGCLSAQSMMGPGMMGDWGGPWGPNNQRYTEPLTIAQAAETAKRYLASLGNSDLALTEVMEFAYNFYAEVEEKSTGIHAFEILIDRNNGFVYPEPGPNMMWNTKYSHMGGYGMMGPGMMGPWGGGWRGDNGPTSTEKDMPITPEQALEIAQKFLDHQLPGVKVEDKADRFYGYYTIHVLKGEKIYGMLSVNGYSGQVWYHTWHGEFIAMEEHD